jgi:hypothetical protein
MLWALLMLYALVSIFTMGAFAVMAWVRLAEQKADASKVPSAYFRPAGAIAPLGTEISLLFPQYGQVTLAFLAAISFKNAVKVWPQFLHTTSTVGSPIIFRPV